MWQKLAEVRKPSRVTTELFLQKKLYNCRYTEGELIEIFVRQLFDYKDQHIEA